MSDFGGYLLLFALLSFGYIAIGFFSQLSQVLGHGGVATIIARIMPRYVTMERYDETEPVSTVPDTSAAEPVLVPSIRTGTLPITNGGRRDIINDRHMRQHDLVALLAIQEDDQGKPVFSANAITGFVGGTRAEVLEVIRTVRAEKTKTPVYPALPPWHGQPRTQMHAMDMMEE